MTDQFFYIREEKITLPDGGIEIKQYNDSFSLNMVTRSMEKVDGGRIVLLKDIHERTTETPDINPKTNRIIGTKRQREVFQSEIHLLPKDNEQFVKLTSAI